MPATIEQLEKAKRLTEKIYNMEQPVPAKTRATSLQQRIDHYISLHFQNEASLKAEADEREFFIGRGENEYAGSDGHSFKVIFPAPRISPDEDAIPKIQSVLGARFDEVFEQKIVYRAIKGCRDLLARVIPPAKLRKFLALAEKECSPQIRFS